MIFSALRKLHPGNFAIVMASGIISIGFSIIGYSSLSFLFYLFSMTSWIFLIVLSFVRLLMYFPVVNKDLLNPRLVFSYFTFVAAAGIVGLLLHQHNYFKIAQFFWWLGFLVWCMLLYISFSVLTFLNPQHKVNIVHGGWLTMIVGTQSLVLLGARISPDLGIWKDYMLLEIHMLWGLGLVFYGVFITLFCHRIFFQTLRPQDTSPLFGVVMGGGAISANAGNSLLHTATNLSFLNEQYPFINGLTMICWAWATWWIPMLFLLALWKHIVKKLPFTYEPVLWSFVFPLGMYAVVSALLGLAADFPPLRWIAKFMIWVAFAAWCGVLLSMLRKFYNYLATRSSQVV